MEGAQISLELVPPGRLELRPDICLTGKDLGNGGYAVGSEVADVFDAVDLGEGSGIFLGRDDAGRVEAVVSKFREVLGAEVIMVHIVDVDGPGIFASV